MVGMDVLVLICVSGDVRNIRDDTSNSESSQDASDSGIVIGESQYPSSVVKVINANALGLSQVTTEGTVVPAGALQTITMTNAGSAAGGTILQYAQSHDGQVFVPGEDIYQLNLTMYMLRRKCKN